MSSPQATTVADAPAPAGSALGQAADAPDAADAEYPGLTVEEARRVRMTRGCHDAAAIAKVPGAGEVFVDDDGRRLQRMHNGLTVEAGAYCGEMMVEIIRELQGHHEPQEEVVTDVVVRRLAAEVADGTSPPPVIVEFGAFWAYFSMWFVRDVPGARAIALEPDPFNLASGRRNAARNGLADRIDFAAGVVGADPGTELDFVAESDGRTYPLPAYDLASLLAEHDATRADVLLLDIQGFELGLLERARDLLTAGAVRFVILSTHHHTISGNPLIHQQCRQLLVECGAHVIAEHTISESYSGDGLIAVSFAPRDADLHVEVSHARAEESLFGGLEKDVAHHQQAAEAARAANEHAQRHIARIEHDLADVTAERDRHAAAATEARRQLDEVLGSRTWRTGQAVGKVTGRLRRR